MEEVIFKCSCGHSETEESFDSWFDENNLNTISFCNNCGKKYSKYYKLCEYTEVE